MCAYVEVSKNNGILEVILNKPKVNAIDHKMSQEIASAFSELKNDQNLKKYPATFPFVFAPNFDFFLRGMFPLGRSPKSFVLYLAGDAMEWLDHFV